MEDGLIEAERKLGVLNLHLVSGEDIIGEVYHKQDPQTGWESYVILKPVIPNVGMRQGEGGQPQFSVGLLPLRPYLGGVPEVEIAKVYVMYPVRVNPQMEKLYREFTSSITLAGPGDIPNLLAR